MVNASLCFMRSFLLRNVSSSIQLIVIGDQNKKTEIRSILHIENGTLETALGVNVAVSLWKKQH